MSDIEKSVVRFNEMYKRLNEQDKETVSNNLFKQSRRIYQGIILYNTYPNLRKFNA